VTHATIATETLGRVYRDDAGRIRATLIRLLGDFELAEEALHDAVAVAAEQWPRDGVPANPRAWLISTGRHRAIDRLRRESRFADKAREVALLHEIDQSGPSDADAIDESGIADDRLRLMFTCCHPALAPEARIALTLRAICGLTTEEIARAFVVPVATMAQRLVRATRKIREARIPYCIPSLDALPERVDAVLSVIYLTFSEGYAATVGDALVRRELCREAIRLGRLVVELVPAATEANGLLALMLLHDSRRAARVGPEGELVLLEDQDRALWDRAEIAEGLARLDAALHRLWEPAGPYVVQAAIAAIHARADRPSDTDWQEIAELYAVLYELTPTPVVELNRAVAIAMAEGPDQGLALLYALDARGDLPSHHLLPAAEADLLRRLGRYQDAAAAYRRALALVALEPERQFLIARLADVESEVR
jgi:RNA polymerase sigma-70 factor, ECF subfamily